jgi:GT2 family glycosyltransferase
MPDVGAVSPKIKFFTHPSLIQYAGFNPVNPFTGRTSTVGEMEEDQGQHDLSGPTHGAHGCAMMIKREVMEKVGMFPEAFFLYYEEWDLSTRILKAGYKICYASDAVIYHKESMTVGKDNPLKTYYLTRNRILYMRRNMKSFHMIVFFAFFTFFSLPKSVVYYLFNRQFTHLKYFIQGALWNLYHSSASVV